MPFFFLLVVHEEGPSGASVPKTPFKIALLESKLSTLIEIDLQKES